MKICKNIFLVMLILVAILNIDFKSVEAINAQVDQNPMTPAIPGGNPNNGKLSSSTNKTEQQDETIKQQDEVKDEKNTEVENEPVDEKEIEENIEQVGKEKTVNSEVKKLPITGM